MNRTVHVLIYRDLRDGICQDMSRGRLKPLHTLFCRQCTSRVMHLSIDGSEFLEKSVP